MLMAKSREHLIAAFCFVILLICTDHVEKSLALPGPQNYFAAQPPAVFSEDPGESASVCFNYFFPDYPASTDLFCDHI
jgi:hypothetical protein